MSASLALLLASSLLAEPDAAERAAAAAEKAAAAAQTAAEAAQKAAEAAVMAAGASRAAPAAVPAAPAPAAPPPKKWTGTLGVGLISLTGNSKSVSFNATGAAEHKNAAWTLGLRGMATYGQTRAPDGSATQTVAQAAGL